MNISTYTKHDLDREARAAVRAFGKTLPAAIRRTIRAIEWELVILADVGPCLRVHFVDEGGRHFVNVAI